MINSSDKTYLKKNLHDMISINSSVKTCLKKIFIWYDYRLVYKKRLVYFSTQSFFLTFLNKLFDKLIRKINFLILWYDFD